ncbi:hypothetical protein, partial [Enterobacter cloacae complex sp. P47BA]|uniref:hypothetical protein n=1 Tax=Enterobacter cloacae complex sp. P47BA TaxID=2779540 RepID=UPI001D054CF2
LAQPVDHTSSCFSFFWGTLSPVGEGQGEGIRPHLSSTHTKMLFASQSKLQINVDCIFLREVTKHIVAN